MGIIKLIERIFLGKRASEENEEVREEIRDMKRKQESEKYRKEMLTAYEDNMKISAETRKIQKKCWEMIKKIEEQYPQIYGHAN